MTQEVAVTCGAETHFVLKAEGLPSGLRRGMERIGIPNLGKGHGDVTATPPPQEDDSALQDKAQFPILIYKLELPYAEMRVGFGISKKGVVAAVGKRCAISGVPNFLDETTRQWREKMHLAATGKGPLEEALEVRVLREVIALTVSGKGRDAEVRKLYPFGLSSEAIATILGDTQLALNAVTLKTRAIIAGLCAILCAAFFYFLFMTGGHLKLTGGWNLPGVVGADIAILGVALGASWTILNFSTRFVLQKRFPQLSVALQQKIGKTGYGMLGAIVAAYALFILLSPVKPLWLAMFMH
jgi:hypothetical protein